MTSSKTLLVAPVSSLPTAAAEIQRISNLLHPDLLINQVTVDSLLDALSKPYQYIHFACHAVAEGIQLSDGQIFPRSRLVQLLRRSNPQCVFLNTCSSLEIAMELHDAIPDCTVIATIMAVEDADAYVTGSLFAAAVATGIDYAAAYEGSRPTYNRIYIMLNGSARFNSNNSGDDQIRLTIKVWTELQRRLDDSDQLSLKNLDATRQLAKNVNAIEQRLANYQRRPQTRQTIFWTGGYIIFCLVLALAYKDVRDLLDLNPLPTLILSMMLLLGAFIMFVMGLGFDFFKHKPQDK